MVSALAVILPLVFGYALVVGIAGWFFMPSAYRQRWWQRTSSMKNRLAIGWFGTGEYLQKTSGQSQRLVARARHATLAFLVEHKVHVLITCAIITMPLVITWHLKPHNILRGYDDQPQMSDPVIIALLQGEQLMPPPPLPPEIFVTQEVTAIRQGLAGASREWMVLDDDFRQRLLTVFHLMAKRGYTMVLIEGYRSPERQAFLASLGAHVTNAGAFQSFHQYGLAADCAFIRNGKLVISERDAWAMEGYRHYGELAESVGLVWGGRWKLMDFGHVELRSRSIMRKSSI